MLQIRQTVTFRKWLAHLEDRTAKARLVRRIERLADGYAGDHRFLGTANDRTIGIQAMNRPSRKQALRTVPFDAAEYLVDEETQLAYLNAALAEGDAQAMVTALGTVARARGMSRVAKRCGLGRESLYKALSDSGNPAFTTIVGVASALGYKFEMRTVPAKRAG